MAKKDHHLDAKKKDYLLAQANKSFVRLFIRPLLTSSDACRRITSITPLTFGDSILAGGGKGRTEKYAPGGGT